MSRALITVCAALLLALSVEARAQPQEVVLYLGQLLPVAFGFCPRGSAPAEGQELSVNQNAALFALLGTTYGGDGMRTFKLPDLRGRVPIGRVPIDQYQSNIGKTGGTQHQQIDLPPKSADSKPLDIEGTPYLAITWCIVLQGPFPSRN